MHFPLPLPDSSSVLTICAFHRTGSECTGTSVVHTASSPLFLQYSLLQFDDRLSFVELVLLVLARVTFVAVAPDLLLGREAALLSGRISSSTVKSKALLVLPAEPSIASQWSSRFKNEKCFVIYVFGVCAGDVEETLLGVCTRAGCVASVGWKQE